MIIYNYTTYEITILLAVTRIFCSNLHFSKNSQRKQAKTKEGVDRWVVIYPKAHMGEKAISRKVKEKTTHSKFKNRLYNVYLTTM